jgi:hypothetical protein
LKDYAEQNRASVKRAAEQKARNETAPATKHNNNQPHCPHPRQRSIDEVAALNRARQAAAAMLDTEEQKVRWAQGAMLPQTLETDEEKVHRARAELRAKLEPKAKAETAVCQAFFEGDVTLPDGTSVEAGSDLTKTWSLRNVGVGAWPASTKVVFVGGSREMLASDELYAVPVPAAAPLACANITVRLRAPEKPGPYRCDFLLQAADGKFFGPGFFVELNVVAKVADHTAALEVLRNMGFDDKATNQRLLSLHSGDVQQVVMAILHLR